MVLSTSHARRPPELFVREERLAPPRPRPTVYLDTTIPSYFAASMSADISRARMQRITRIWWARYRPHCDVFISNLLLAEARDGSEYAARKRLAALDEHLANRMIFRRVTQRCESLGFCCPQIRTPETMMRICVDERRTD